MTLHEHDDGSRHLPGTFRTALLGKRIEIGSYLGQLRISVELPPRAARVDVHLGSAQDFHADARNLIASMRAPGVLFTSAPYDEPSFVRLVPFDEAGHRMASMAVRVQPTRPVYLDLDGLS